MRGGRTINSFHALVDEADSGELQTLNCEALQIKVNTRSTHRGKKREKYKRTKRKQIN